jgi:hypothetical protein
MGTKLNGGSTPNISKKVSRLFPCLYVKKGFRFWGGRLKVIS